MAFDIVNEGIILSVTDNDLISIGSNKEESIIEIVSSFTEPRSLDEAYDYTLKKIYVDKDDFEECFEFMRENNILKEVDGENILTEYQSNKYTRQISSFNSLKGIERKDALAIQKKLCGSTVCIVGVGGVGSYASLAMTMVGVEHLILVDFDKVELSNTARQVLYDEGDIGKYKIDAAKERLKKYNRNTVVDTHNIQISSAEDLDVLKNYKIDLLILCADTPRGEIQFIIDEVAQKFNIPWFCFGPYNHSQVFVGPMIIPGKTKSYSDIFPHDVSAFTDRVSKINESFVASICDPYNGFAGQFAAIEAFKFLTGIQEPSIINKKYYINTDTWTMNYDSYE